MLPDVSSRYITIYSQQYNYMPNISNERELMMLGVVFALKKWECFIENYNATTK